MSAFSSLFCNNLLTYAMNDDCRDINLYGGLVSGSLTKKVTIILCQNGDAEGYNRVKDKAAEWNIPIVSETFLTECIRQSHRISPKAHLVTPPPAPAPAAPEKKVGGRPKRAREKGDDSSSDEDTGRKRKKKEEEEPKIEFVIGCQPMGLYSVGKIEPINSSATALRASSLN